MIEIKYNIDSEKRFIELLGYSLVGPNGSNRWTILDKNQNQVGYIQYKKMSNGNSRKGNSKIFGYYTFIDSSTISCDFSRQLNDEKGNIIDSDGAIYSFNIKRDNQDVDNVHIVIGDYPSLTMYSKKYGNISFQVDYQGLFLNFKSRTDNFNIEEVLVYKNVDDEHHYDKEYCYQIRNCKKDIELSDDNPKGRISREIRGIQRWYEENQMTVTENTWVYGKLRNYRKSVVQGTVEEMATKNQMGIDCFNHFRFLINQIIPFNEDIISLMISEDRARQDKLLMFFPEYNKEEGKTKTKMISK